MRGGARLRCQRGTASVEAVVMLPFLVLLVAGAFYIHRLGATRAQLSNQARACAWAHGLAGCPEALPAVCEDDAGTTSEGGGTQAMREAQSETERNEEVVRFDDFMGHLGFLRPLFERFLGESLETTRSGEVAALMQRDGKVTVGRRVVALCNPRPMKFDLLEQILSFATGRAIFDFIQDDG